jgi:hypothetical protein
MRGTVALVTVMTLMLFAGLGLLAYGVATKMRQDETAAMRELELPAVASVQMMSPWKNGVALYLVTPGGDFLYLVDPAKEKPVRIPVVRRADAVQNP